MARVKCILISEPTAEVALTDAVAATAATPMITTIAVAELEGYDVPNFIWTTPATSSTTTHSQDHGSTPGSQRPTHTRPGQTRTQKRRVTGNPALKN